MRHVQLDLLFTILAAFVVLFGGRALVARVGVLKRFAVMDCAEKGAAPQPLVLVNPEILERSDEQPMEEGCLSVPGYSDTIKRYNRLRMRALDRHGQPFELEAEGLTAQAIQHELDHLDGKLFVDYLSSLKRERLRKKLQKQAARQ